MAKRPQRKPPRKTSKPDVCVLAAGSDTATSVPLPRNGWHAVPGLASGVTSNAGESIEISVTAEIRQAGGSIWFRALVDGVPANPSDVLIKASDPTYDGTRSFTFVQENVTAGQHIVEIEANTGSNAAVMQRTLTLHSAPPAAGGHRLKVVAAPSGPNIKNNSSSYEDVPGLTTSITTTAQSGFAITFGAEAGVSQGRLMARALIDGAQVGKEIIFDEAGIAHGGTRSIIFAAPVVQPGNHNVRIQWKATKGKAWLGDRTLTVSSAGLNAQRQLAKGINDSVSLNAYWKTTMQMTIDVEDPVSVLAISFSAELTSGSNGVIYAGAMIDGHFAQPSMLKLLEGPSKWGAVTVSFIKKNLAPGRHTIRVDLCAHGSGCKFRRTALRANWQRRSGSDFVQPFLATQPTMKIYKMLVIGCDPMRPGHPQPSFAQVRSVFEGVEILPPTPAPASPGIDASKRLALPEIDVPNLRDWLAENSGGRAKIGQVSYYGCQDGNWYTPPPEHQGNYYWDNGAWAEMFRDAVLAADPDVNFHSLDVDGNNHIAKEETIIVAMRPQDYAYGTLRGTTTRLDNTDPPLAMPLIDLYLSKNPSQHLAGVGIAAHELCHLLLGISESYGNCNNIDPGYYSVMDGLGSYAATHLDPHSKMKAGWVQPIAVNLDDIKTSATFALGAVESRHQTLLVHDANHVAREYFIIENRFPGNPPRNYDKPMGQGSIAIWQVFEDLQLVHSAAICNGDPRYVRFRKALLNANETHVLTWGDGSPTGFRVVALSPNGATASFRLERIKVRLPDILQRVPGASIDASKV